MQTQAEIVTRALQICGVVPQGKSPTPTQTSEADKVLLSFLASLSNIGLRGFTNTQQTISITTGVQDYSTGVLSVLMHSAFVRDSNADDWSLTFITAEQYDTIVDKTDTGRPKYAFVVRDPNLYYQIKVHPVPDTTYTMYYRSVEDISQPTDREDGLAVPQRWEDVIVYGLASNLADLYQIPDNMYARVNNKFQMLLELAKGRDHAVQDWVSVEPI